MQDAQPAIFVDVDAMQQLPTVQWAWTEGIAYRQLLVRLTGLSEARLSKGGLSGLRQSTIARMMDHAAAAGRRDAGLSDENATSPGARVSPLPEGSGSWSAYAVGFERWSSQDFSLLRGHALRLDQRLRALRDLAEADNFSGFHRLSSEFAAELSLESEPELSRARWAQSTDWASLHSAARCLLGTWWADFHAALDAEWGFLQVPELQPAPLFSFVLPRCTLLPHRTELGWREFTRAVRRPVRLLLEMMYVMQHRAGRGVWPSRPPGARELARAAWEEDSTITNYFDGTKKLRMAAAQQIWTRLGEDLGASPNGFPAAVAATAICWQRMLLPQDLRKVSEIEFQGSHLHRVLWGRHLARLPVRPGITEAWPRWLTG